MLCSRCRSENRDGAHTCFRCGSALNSAPSTKGFIIAQDLDSPGNTAVGYEERSGIASAGGYEVYKTPRHSADNVSTAVHTTLERNTVPVENVVSYADMNPYEVPVVGKKGRKFKVAITALFIICAVAMTIILPAKFGKEEPVEQKIEPEEIVTSFIENINDKNFKKCSKSIAECMRLEADELKEKYDSREFVEYKVVEKNEWENCEAEINEIRTEKGLETVKVKEAYECNLDLKIKSSEEETTKQEVWRIYKTSRDNWYIFEQF